MCLASCYMPHLPEGSGMLRVVKQVKTPFWAGARLQSHRRPVGGSPAQDSLLVADEASISSLHCNRLILFFCVRPSGLISSSSPSFFEGLLSH